MGRHPSCAYPNIPLPSRQMASCPQGITCSRPQVCRIRAWCSRVHRRLHGMAAGVLNWQLGLDMQFLLSGPQEPGTWSLTGHSSRTLLSPVMLTGISNVMRVCWQMERSRHDSTRSIPVDNGRGMRVAVDADRGRRKQSCPCGMLGAWTSTHSPSIRALPILRSRRSWTSCFGIVAATGGPRVWFDSFVQPSGGRHDPN